MDFDLNCTPAKEEDVPGGGHHDRDGDFNMEEEPGQDAGSTRRTCIQIESKHYHEHVHSNTSTQYVY